LWFAYIDESKEAGQLYIYTAIVTNGERWQQAFTKVKAFREELRREHGIFLSQELHAWKFAAGKGRVSDRVLSKQDRALIFRKVLRFIVESRAFAVVGSCNRNEQYAFERLINRLDRTARAKQENLLLFFDEGEQAEITRRIRRMRVHNPIPSRFGTWQDSGSTTKSIPLSSIVEDPIFKDSAGSYFIQLADFCAYALLRMERPIASRSCLGYDTAFEELREATRVITNRSDPRGMGIIR